MTEQLPLKQWLLVDNLKSKRHITPIITTTTQVMRCDEEEKKINE
jgi:hypothetical protein